MKRFNNYKRFTKLNILLKVLIVISTAIITFFSILSIPIDHIDKKVITPNYSISLQNKSENDQQAIIQNPQKGSQGRIIQIPQKDSKFKDELMSDINNLKFNPYIAIDNENNFIATSNPNSDYHDISGGITNSYHKGGRQFGDSHTMTFVFSLVVNGIEKATDTWNKWIDDNDSYGWADIKLHFNVSGVKPDDNVSVNLKRVYVLGNWDWDAELTMTTVSSSETSRILANYIHGNVINYDINDVTLHMLYDGSNESGFDDMKVEIRDIDRVKFDITTHSHVESTISKKLYAKKIFMSEEEYKNQSFSTNDLKKWVTLKDFNDSILVSDQKNRSLIDKIFLNKNTKKLEVTISEMHVGPDYYKPQTISIPIITANLNYFIQASLFSSSYWEHLKTGETRYHTLKPKTTLEMNNDFIKSIYILFKKNELISKLDKDWNFVGGDKQVAIAKVNSYAINVFNYEKIRQGYLYGHNQNIFNTLNPPSFIKKYEDIIDTENNSLENYLYILKNAKFSFDYGNTILKNKESSIEDLSKRIDVNLTDEDIRANSRLSTSWKMKISNLKIKFNDENFIFTNTLKINIPKDNLENYDLKLTYTKGSGEKSITHSYLYQNEGIDISKDITFIMEDGTLLDENYKIIKPSKFSSLKIGDWGYVTARYWATLGDKVQEYIIVTNNNGTWYSPKYKKNIQSLDSNFDLTKLEYVFNQSLQMVINPYSNTQGTSPIDVIKAGGKARYGIKTVNDNQNGVEKILEDWNDGKWSHTHGIDGLATFDGVFGSDMNGILDANGRLGEGLHKITINLQNQTFTGLKQSFTIFVDKNPLKVDVSSPLGVLQKLEMNDDQGNPQKLYFSNQPINFEIKDIDLKSIEAKFIDGNGNWYDLPISSKSKMVDGKWVQTVNSTIDYAGFAKIIITDQANNISILYFWLKQDDKNSTPKYDYEIDKLFSGEKRKFGGIDLDIFNKLTSVKLSSPLVSSINVHKLVLDNGTWKTTKDLDNFKVENWDPKSGTHKYGKTITSTTSSLRFAGDELKPFITKNTDTKWKIENKIIKFLKPGLYKISLKTRIIKNTNIDYYIYIKENNMIPIAVDKALEELSNFKELQHKDKGELDGIDEVVKTLSKINVKFPKFLISKYKVFYSLPWYSEFNEIIEPNLEFSKEGKYKIQIVDIFKRRYEYEILLIDKEVKYLDRREKGMTPLSTPHPKYLSPYEDQLIFNHLEWSKDWNSIKINFNSILANISGSLNASPSKVVKLDRNMLSVKNNLVTIKVFDQNDYNIKNTKFGIWLAIKKQKDGSYNSWLFTTFDGNGDHLTKHSITTFISQITINSIGAKEINIFENDKQEKVLKNKTTWYRQGLLFSGANSLSVSFNEKDTSKINKKDYGTKKQLISQNNHKYSLYFNVFHLNENTEKDKSFYKGKNVWAYVRYEDEDHLIWERDEFVKEAMRNGLTWDQAHKFYKHMKFKPTWNGNVNALKWTNKDWQSKYKEYITKFTSKHNKLKFPPINYETNDSNKKTLSILFGTLGSLALLIITYVLFKRFKGKKIK